MFAIATGWWWMQYHHGAMGVLHLPVPECRIAAHCAGEYARTCARVSDPPPLFDWYRHFMPMFGVYQQAVGLPAGLDRRQAIRYVIVPKDDDMEGVYAMFDTWASAPQGLSVTFVLSEHPDTGGKEYMMPPEDMVQVIPDLGVSLGIVTPEQNVSSWHGSSPTQHHLQKLNDMAQRHYLRWEHRCLKALRYAYDATPEDVQWFYAARDTVMPFHDRILDVLRGVDPETPLIVSYLVSSLDMPRQISLHAGAMAGAYRVDGGLTYGSMDVGMVISRGAMRMLAENLGRGKCAFAVSADLTISRCAWRIGIYLVHHRQMRAALDQSLQHETDPGRVAHMDLCSDTMSVHYMDMRYRSHWVECDLINKYYSPRVG
eukprot:CAMPEP_0173436998 /NCGR_PEP_ID=MMETSP1357-20121228/17791_1 /TAXON_ID=77926 /ORGANISM="Hemiselmis rufescens, Strain PCC563" /LENGTH=371 /DNA_ID=CAMNT_0014402153 /DNA_START=149 /DNA_END=1264 /DNA_ORIENTATION=+